ncbi:serine/threonine-protein kinase 19-like isoform X2 [Rhinichthys klamathensis goyatoka]|uniref:serine/threonine-protein kinase 19-like isoform X2 n=1 Tax=Rhinichthys klamathensis goyatoka TaxID=3034132 RepID=UPI0024B56ADF|nr:serine/threonine-protein kinase 19-like isoform X2 [Rhinichthys klamathensis goyatoka]
MSRKRALIADTFCLKRRRSAADAVAGDSHEGAADIRSSLQNLMTLFSRKLFNDSLPPVVLKHQLYSLHSDRTSVDKQLNELRASGELLMFQLGFDSEAFALVFAEDYRAKVLQGEAGRETLETVEKFLDKLIPGCSDLSFNKEKMLKEFLFTDSEITQLVKSGVLTVRDAGSWWLSIPNSGKFIKYFIKGRCVYHKTHDQRFNYCYCIISDFITGRKAVLGMVKKSKYSEILKTELEGRRTTSHVKFQMKYHIHDIVGAELVECIQTTSGTVLRYVDGNIN